MDDTQYAVYRRAIAMATTLLEVDGLIEILRSFPADPRSGELLALANEQRNHLTETDG